MKRLYPVLIKVVGQLHRSRVMLLAGTDVAVTRVPGFSLHDELSLLVKAGLTPLEAIQAEAGPYYACSHCPSATHLWAKPDSRWLIHNAFCSESWSHFKPRTGLSICEDVPTAVRVGDIPSRSERDNLHFFGQHDQLLYWKMTKPRF
jgi:hypothetical protein